MINWAVCSLQTNNVTKFFHMLPFFQIICCKLEYKLKLHDIFGMSVCTHAGCDLVFDVAFEAVHL